MVGVYEAIFTALSGDATLQTLLSGSATDKRVYPITHVGRAQSPAIRVAVINGASDVGLSVDRLSVDILVSSKINTTELNNISARVDTLLNRKRLAGPSGSVMHLCRKIYESDGYDSTELEYQRVVRYRIIKT
jgi:hypothetical protein